MGGSSITCTKNSIHNGKIDAVCYTGFLRGDKARYGLISESIEKDSYCLEESIWEDPKNKGMPNCTATLD